MSFFKKYYSRFKKLVSPDPDAFLKQITGVIHIGANEGQEADQYNQQDLHVLWVEAIPDLYEKLKINIARFSKQKAISALVTNSNEKIYEFHIANNLGASSSIFDLKDHKNIWPDVEYTKSISLQGITLSKLYNQYKIDPSLYQALIMDTQGSELLILEGAIDLLSYFKFIKVEVADFEIYSGCCQLKDIQLFMHKHNYREIFRKPFPIKYSGGQCYDIVYQKFN
jgi:FkbM family methyltransferase